jgi:hypothetical protein
MKKFLLKLTKYGLIALILGNLIGWSGDFFLRKSSWFKPSFLVNNFNQEEKFDYFVLGSSRGFTTLNSIQIDNILKTNGINLSMDDTDLKTHVLMTKHFFENGYKSDFCFLTLDYSNFNNTQKRLGDNDFRFSPFISKNYAKNHYNSYENHILKPNFNSLYFPIIKYSYYNLQLIPSAIVSMIFPKKRYRFDKKGNYTYPTTRTSNSTYKVPKIKYVQIKNPLVDTIRNICQKNGTKLIIYVAPYKKEKLNLLGAKNTINHSGILQKNSLFFDDIHVNTLGRKKATEYFINDVKEQLIKTKPKNH